ncbi:MAG: 4-hydroxy-tetrahydrodipicolinate synthase [Candidatus Desulforudaceae bacterium]
MVVLAIDFGRVLTAMVTPFDDQLNLNIPVGRKLARHLVEHGSDGLVVSGTTGESPTLTEKEKIDLLRAVVDEVGGKATVVAGTGSYSTAASIALTQAASKVGVDAIMLVCPYYNKPSQDGLYNHFRVIAESTHLPVMLYNIPGRTGVNLLPDTVLKLAEVPNIVAIKEASGSTDQATELIRRLPEGFAVYSGDDSLTLPLLSVGARGVVSVVAHLIGDRMQELINAYTSGNPSLAAKIQSRLYPLMKGMFIDTNPVPVKAALNQMGWNVGGTRLPLSGLSPDKEAKLRELLKSHNLI